MRKFTVLTSAAICLAVVVFQSSTRAAVLVDLYNTGVADVTHTVLPDNTIGDPHYSLLAVPSGSTQLRVRTSASGFPIPPYIGDNTLSRWVGPNNTADLVSPPGNYTFRTTFDLAGFVASTASISGKWSSDNDGVDILLNGISIGAVATAFDQFTQGFAPFTITSGFVAGVNTLDFIVHNGGTGIGNNSGGSNPAALRVEMTGQATAVPEASSFLVIGLGGIFAFGAIGLGKRYGISAKL